MKEVGKSIWPESRIYLWLYQSWMSYLAGGWIGEDHKIKSSRLIWKTLASHGKLESREQYFEAIVKSKERKRNKLFKKSTTVQTQRDEEMDWVLAMERKNSHIINKNEK